MSTRLYFLVPTVETAKSVIQELQELGIDEQQTSVIAANTTPGVLLVLFPLTVVLTLSLMISVFFLVGGAFRIVHALQWRPAPSGGGFLPAVSWR